DTPATGYVWDTLKEKTFTKDLVNDRGKQDPVVVSLNAGPNFVKVHLREDGTLLDKIALVGIGGSPSTPTPTSTAVLPTPTPTNKPVLPTATPTATGTPSAACGPMMQEAENGIISGSAFVIGSRSDASNGQFVHVPDKAGNNYGGVANSTDFVTYCFNVPAAGDYQIEGWVTFEGIQHLSDSFFIQVNDAPATGYVWDTLKEQVFAKDLVNDRNKQDPVVVSLSAGPNYVKVHLREDGTLLDKIALVPIAN
ncbi:MAG: hypothetical protein AAGD96_10495, partial [Chloroflexota bacterium]